MLHLTNTLRTISLAILGGGCIGVTVSAISLVKAAEAKGMTAAVAATANAPMFITFSTVMLVCAIVLLITEFSGWLINKNMTKFRWARIAASAIACVGCFVLSFAIIPPMKGMLGEIHATEQTEATWKKFHESARIVFGIIILSSMTSLCMPGFEKKEF